MTSKTWTGVFTLLVVSTVVAEEQRISPNVRAFQMAASQKRVQSLMKELRNEADRIKDPTLRNDALSLLDRPNYKVFKERKSSEAEIVKKLHAARLLDPSLKTIFPSHSEMRFEAAPASGTTVGHHAYPGGLVYHALTNLRSGLALANVYKQIYQVDLNPDSIRLTAIWHDGAKTFTLAWNPDGSLELENKIAGTGAHHIWGLAEALYRKWPGKMTVVLASAHSPPHAGEDVEKLVKFLRAAAIIAGVSNEAAGLTSDGKGLAELPSIEAFINHLDDHDYIFTENSMTETAKVLDEMPGVKGDLWKRSQILSERGDVLLYQWLADGGKPGFQQKITDSSEHLKK